jgi:hypothetical protein
MTRNPRPERQHLLFRLAAPDEHIREPGSQQVARDMLKWASELGFP